MIHPTLHHWKYCAHAFTYRGHNIFYRDEGQGDVLLSIHGFPTSSWDWHRIWAALIGRFRVIAPDMIGFGYSDKPRDYDYSIFDQATLHEELLQALAIQSVDILAHDYGDTVVQELLARDRERKAKGEATLEIRSVCLLNGGIFTEAIRPRFIQRLLMSPIGFLVGKFLTEKRFGKSFSAIFGPDSQPSAEELRTFWSLITYNNGPAIAHKLIRYMGARKKYRERWVGALQETDIPLRLIYGPQYPVSGKAIAARYDELIPNPDIVTLERYGHYPQIEHPAGVIEAYLEFRDRG
jgi:pimeloyl-ACP methyl ester carboxylesterase